MSRMARLYAKLKLKVNEEKSTVARVWGRKFLGYSFWVAPGKLVKRRVAPKALKDFKERIRQITSRNGGRSLERVVEELRSYLLGWKGYFLLADTPRIFQGLDQWIARRLRMVQLKQWKRGTTVYRELRRRGVPERVSRAAAAHGRSWWRIAGHGANEYRYADEVSGRIGTSEAGTALNLNFPNRRMLTRMSGGVGGE